MMIFDPSNYAKAPQLPTADTIALVRALIAAAEETKRHSKVRVVLGGLRTSGERLQTVFFMPVSASSVSREVDSAMDRIWGAIEARLSAANELGGDAEAAARNAHRILFPNGLSFLAARYTTQWAEGEAIFSRLESEGLTATVIELVGAEYLEVARARHADYGRVLGVTAALEPTSEPALAEPLRQTRGGIAAYARIVSALVEMGDFSESVGLAALLPIDKARAEARERRANKAAAAPDEESIPLPAV